MNYNPSRERATQQATPCPIAFNKCLISYIERRCSYTSPAFTLLETPEVGQLEEDEGVLAGIGSANFKMAKILSYPSNVLLQYFFLPLSLSFPTYLSFHSWPNVSILTRIGLVRKKRRSGK